MNLWYAAAIPMLLCLVPCIAVAVRGRTIDALIALEVATVLSVLVLLLAEQGMQRQTFFDVPLALAVLAFPASLLFARFYRRWL